MKKILITLPIRNNEKERFYNAVAGSREKYEPLFMKAEEVKRTDVHKADIIIGMVEPEMLKEHRKLEWLQLGWAGAEKYCEEGVLSENTILTNASGAYGIAVSEHMVSLTLALTCGISSYVRQQEKHIWKLRQRAGIISDSTVLIYGMGDIGKHYACIMRSMGCKVIGISRREKEKLPHFDEQYTIDRQEQIIGQADVIALALPGGDKTKHIINAERIKKMKPGVLLVNAGRGSTIDTEALIEGLKQGIIGGAGLDVLEKEPPEDTVLWDMDNVIITPHAAGKLEDAFNRKAVRELCLDNLYRYTHGQELLHVVDRKMAY